MRANRAPARFDRAGPASNHATVIGTNEMAFAVLSRRLASYRAALIIGAIVLPALGCSTEKKRTGKVNLDGIVTVQGQPLKSGIIKFVCEDNEICTADVSNGKFTVVDVTPGKVSVSVEPPASGAPDKQPNVPGGKKSSRAKVDFASLKAKEYTVSADQMRIEVTIP